MTRVFIKSTPEPSLSLGSWSPSWESVSPSRWSPFERNQNLSHQPTEGQLLPAAAGAREGVPGAWSHQAEGVANLTSWYRWSSILVSWSMLLATCLCCGRRNVQSVGGDGGHGAKMPRLTLACPFPSPTPHPPSTEMIVTKAPSRPQFPTHKCRVPRASWGFLSIL